MVELGSILPLVFGWAIMITFGWFNYYLWLVPLNRIRSLEDVGYAHLKEVSQRRKKEKINQV